MRVAVLFGGPSLEHDVSVDSGSQVLEFLDRGRFQPTPVKIERDGGWSVDGTRFDGPLAAAAALVDAKIEVVFLALHGPFGEDGVVQGSWIPSA